MKLAFKTPAKINLALNILGKREDGYHELETLLQMVSLYDRIELESTPSTIELDCNHPDIPSDSSNLAVRAALLLKKHFYERKELGCRIRLEKNIPAGAGLGGGSGNAAGVLWGLNVLWDLKLTRENLRDLAADLGSDVPFFLCSPLALGTGRGEKVTPLQPIKKLNVVLVFPGFSIAASEVYGSPNLKLTTRKNNISIIQKNLSQSGFSDLGTHLHNDLEPVVVESYPVINEIKNELRALRAKGALLSGSGSTVFAVFEDSKVARLACSVCKKGDWDTFLTETISSFSEFLPESMINYP